MYFSGQVVSLVGSWITTATTAWLVYHLSGKNFLLGLSAFLAQVPAFVLTPFLGVMVDRWDLRRTVFWSQVASLAESAGLAGATWAYVGGHLSALKLIASLLSLQFVQGLINAIDLPARQAFGIQMVDRKDDLPNAIALNTTMINVSRFIGPALSGAIIALGGAGARGAAWCYSIDVVSYIGVICALAAIRPRVLEARPARRAFAEEFQEGLKYVAHTPVLRTCLLLLCNTSFFGVAINTQIAAIASSRLGVGPEKYGLLVGLIGGGATFSAVYLATRRTITGLPALISYACTLFGLCILALALTTQFTLALMIMPVLGAAMVLQSSSTNTVLQSVAADHMRGRVMSFFTVAFMGTVPLGALTLGFAAQMLSMRTAMLIDGTMVLIGALVAMPRLKAISRDMRAVAAKVEDESAEEVSDPAATN